MRATARFVFLALFPAWGGIAGAPAAQGSGDGSEAPKGMLDRTASHRPSESFSPVDVLAWEGGDAGAARIELRSDRGSLTAEVRSVDVLGPDAAITSNFVEPAGLGGVRAYRGPTSDGRMLFVASVGDELYARAAHWSDSGTQAEVPEVTAEKAPHYGAELGIGSWPLVDVAVDADWEFFVIWGNANPSQTVARMVNTVNELDFVFMREVGIRYRISWVNYWRTSYDPYWSLNTKDLVNGMQEIWNQHAGFVPRDSAHLFSGKVMDRNGATPNDDGDYPGHICNVFDAYSVSSPITQSQLPSYLPLPLDDDDVSRAMDSLLLNVVHEQGHQWGAEHCAGDCYAMCGETGCAGYILQFGQQSTSSISAHLQQTACLAHVPAPNQANGPDLVVDAIDVPSAFGQGTQPVVQVRVRNAGLAPAQQQVMLWSWLTLDGDPFSGFDDIPMGGPGVDSFLPGFHVDLEPGESAWYAYQTAVVPPGIFVGPQTFVVWIDAGAGPCASLCEADEGNNLGEASTLVTGPDGAILSVDAPSAVAQGSFFPVTVEVKNNGPTTLDIPVGVDVCGGQNFQSLMAFGMSPGEVRTLTFNLLAPVLAFDCGSPNSCYVRACANLAVDTNPANNCRSESVQLVDLPYWDLKVTVDPSSDSVLTGQSTSWMVRVENVGTMNSDWANVQSGIGLNSWNWDFNLGLNFRSVPPVAPGSTYSYPVHSYFVPSFFAGTICPSTQYVKAQIVAGDACSSGNYDHDTIDIYCGW